MYDFILKNQNEWKGSELSTRIMGKVLHEIFKAVVNDLKNALSTLGESVSEVSHFIPE